MKTDDANFMREAKIKWEEIISISEINHLLMSWVLNREQPRHRMRSLSHTGFRNHWTPSVSSARLTLSTVWLANCRAVWVLSWSCCGYLRPTSLSIENGLLSASSDHCWQLDWALGRCGERHNWLQFPNSHQESHSKINQCFDVCWLFARLSKNMDQCVWGKECGMFAENVHVVILFFLLKNLTWFRQVI